jgi:hypothetical protein
VVTDPNKGGSAGKELRPMVKLVDAKVTAFILPALIFRRNIFYRRARLPVLKTVVK